MAHETNDLLNYLGFVTWGDMGPLTIYRDKRGRMVSYAKAPPKTPTTPRQKIYRDKWRCAAQGWNELPPYLRRNWELASKRASLRVTGYNLWVYYCTTGDRPTIQTLERLTRLELLPWEEGSGPCDSDSDWDDIDW